MIYQVTKLIFLFQFTKFSMHWNKKNVCFCFLFTYKRDYNKIRITEHLVRNTCERLRNIEKILSFGGIVRIKALVLCFYLGLFIS